MTQARSTLLNIVFQRAVVISQWNRRWYTDSLLFGDFSTGICVFRQISTSIVFSAKSQPVLVFSGEFSTSVSVFWWVFNWSWCFLAIFDWYWYFPMSFQLVIVFSDKFLTSVGIFMQLSTDIGIFRRALAGCVVCQQVSSRFWCLLMSSNHCRLVHLCFWLVWWCFGRFIVVFRPIWWYFGLSSIVVATSSDSFLADSTCVWPIQWFYGWFLFFNQFDGILVCRQVFTKSLCE